MSHIFLFCVAVLDIQLLVSNLAPQQIVAAARKACGNMPATSTSSKSKAAKSRKATARKKPLIKKDPPTQKTRSHSNRTKKTSQGVVKVQGITMDKFSLPSFVDEVLRVLGLAPNLEREPVKFATACSGSGAPSLVLQKMVAATELMASDINAAAAHACLLNAQPLHCQANVVVQASKDRAFCFACNQKCPVLKASAGLDIFMAGFPCNFNSLMKSWRFNADATQTPDAKVFEACAKLVGQLKPKVIILENVTGVTRKRGGQSTDADKPVIDWIFEELKKHSGGTYEFQQVLLTGSVLWNPQRRLKHSFSMFVFFSSVALLIYLGLSGAIAAISSVPI